MMSRTTRPSRSLISVTSSMGGWTWLGLAMVLLLAAGLRLPGLGVDSLWNNEVLSYQRATQPSLAESYAMIREGTHPPLYAIGVLRPLSALGLDERLQRMPSAVFGVFTVVLVLVFTARAFSSRAALLAALLLSVMPLHVYYSREGRMYALLALLCMLAMACLSRALKRGDWSAWLGYAVFGAASLYTHYYAGLTLAAAGMAAFGLLLARGDWVAVRQCLLWHLVLALLFVPWLPTLWYQLHNEPVAHLQALSLFQVAGLPVLFFTAFEAVPTLVALSCAVAIAVLGLSAVASLKRPTGPAQGSQDLLLLLAAVLGTLGFAVLISLVKPILFVRYLVGVLPFLAIVLAVGATWVRPRWLAFAALAVLLLTGLWGSLQTVQSSWRPNFKAPLALVERSAGPQAQLLLLAPAADSMHLLGFEHYFQGGMPLRRLYGPEATPDRLAAALPGLPEPGGEVWVLQLQPVGAAPLEVAGFKRVFSQDYPSRFFTGDLVVALSRYERGAASSETTP